jgi:hypothetical protein
LASWRVSGPDFYRSNLEKGWILQRFGEPTFPNTISNPDPHRNTHANGDLHKLTATHRQYYTLQNPLAYPNPNGHTNADEHGTLTYSKPFPHTKAFSNDNTHPNTLAYPHSNTDPGAHHSSRIDLGLHGKSHSNRRFCPNLYQYAHVTSLPLSNAIPDPLADLNTDTYTHFQNHHPNHYPKSNPHSLADCHSNHSNTGLYSLADCHSNHPNPGPHSQAHSNTNYSHPNHHAMANSYRYVGNKNLQFPAQVDTILAVAINLQNNKKSWEIPLTGFFLGGIKIKARCQFFSFYLYRFQDKPYYPLTAR